MILLDRLEVFNISASSFSYASVFSYRIFKTGSFVKSDGAQSDGSESRLGIKTYENTNFSSESLAF